MNGKNHRFFRRGAHWASVRYKVTLSNHDRRIHTIFRHFPVISAQFEIDTQRTPNGRPYEKDVGLCGFAGSDTTMEAGTAREDNILPYSNRVFIQPVKFQLAGDYLSVKPASSISRVLL